MVWYSHLSQNFSQFIVIHTVKSLGIVNKAEIDVFLDFLCFLHHPMNIDNTLSDSSVCLKASLYIWKFLIQVLLKPNLKDFFKNLFYYYYFLKDFEYNLDGM